jgi:hypothetical protein
LRQFETQQGTWSATEEVLTGICGDLKRGYVLSGTEDDHDQVVEATLKIVNSSRASVIVSLTYEADWAENCIECVLDAVSNQLKIFLVIAGVAVEMNRDFEIDPGIEYKVKVEVITESDGSGLLLFTVNGILQFPMIADLATVLTTGMVGFAVEGTEQTQSATFSGIRIYSMLGRYCSLADIKTILDLLKEDTYNEELAGCAKTADDLVDKQLEAQGLAVTAGDETIKNASAYLAAWVFRKRRDPTGAQAFQAEAQRFLDTYVAANEDTSTFVRTA